MSYFKKQPPRQDAKPLSPLGRWWHAVTSHYCFVVLIHLLLCLTLVPALYCLYCFFATGALIFLVGWILLAFLPGPFFAAAQRAAWEIQYGFPTYLFKSFFHWVRVDFRQGAALGVILAALWSLLLAPPVIMALGGQGMPSWMLACLALGGAVLSIVECYAFYQAARWELKLGALLKNSVLLVFAAGWPSLVAGLVWLALPVALVAFFPFVFPFYLVLGLPILLMITAQAAFAPRLDKILGGEAQGEEAS